MTKKRSLNPETALWARELWDKALEGGGIELTYETMKQAQRVRFSLYTARTIDREQNKAIYGEGDVMYGRSLWDSLMVTLEGPLKNILRIAPEKAIAATSVREL